MSTDNKTTNKSVYEGIITCAHFGLNLVSTISYGVEKVKRVPEIRLKLENSFADTVMPGPVEGVKTSTEVVLSMLGIASQICNAAKYVVTIVGYIGGGVTIMGTRLDKWPAWLRLMLQIILVFALIRIGLRVAGKHMDYIKDMKKKWDWPLSLLSKGGAFLFGIFQLYLFFKAENIPAGKKVFMLSSIADDLTAPLDLSGVDNLVLNIPMPKGEIVYAVIYGSRVVLKSVKTAGVLIH